MSKFDGMPFDSQWQDKKVQEQDKASKNQSKPEYNLRFDIDYQIEES